MFNFIITGIAPLVIPALIVYGSVRNMRSIGEEADTNAENIKKAVNTVMIGKMAQDLDIPRAVWLDVISSCVKPQFIDINIKAFELGFGA